MPTAGLQPTFVGEESLPHRHTKGWVPVRTADVDNANWSYSASNAWLISAVPDAELISALSWFPQRPGSVAVPIEHFHPNRFEFTSFAKEIDRDNEKPWFLSGPSGLDCDDPAFLLELLQRLAEACRPSHLTDTIIQFLTALSRITALFGRVSATTLISRKEI
jgi:hypothetical protein